MHTCTHDRQTLKKQTENRLMRCWPPQSLVHAWQAINVCAKQSGATLLPETSRSCCGRCTWPAFIPKSRSTSQVRPRLCLQALSAQAAAPFTGQAVTMSLCQHQQVHVSLAVHNTCQDSCESTSSHLCCNIQHHSRHWQAKNNGWAQRTGRVDHAAGVGASCGGKASAVASANRKA